MPDPFTFPRVGHMHGSVLRLDHGGITEFGGFRFEIKDALPGPAVRLRFVIVRSEDSVGHATPASSLVRSSPAMLAGGNHSIEEKERAVQVA